MIGSCEVPWMPSSAATFVPVREVRILRGAIAVEDQVGGVDAVRSEVVRPAQVRIIAEAVARIYISEELRVLALAPLEAFVQRQPVVLAEILVKTQTDVIGVCRNYGDKVVVLYRARKIR